MEIAKDCDALRRQRRDVSSRGRRLRRARDVQRIRAVVNDDNGADGE